jgi:hypothetical protein
LIPPCAGQQVPRSIRLTAASDLSAIEERSRFAEATRSSKASS